MSENVAVPPLAGWPRRIIALFVDWFVALLTVSAITGAPIWGGVDANPWWNLLAFFVEVSVLTALLGYSIGQRLTGVKIARMGGGQVDPLRAMLRTALICAIVPPLVNDEFQRGLHDRAAGSVAVRAGGG
ncbi:MAG: RDD family protein [Nocardioidaceae bacterium]